MIKHKVNFYLRWPDKADSPVYAYVTFNGERLRFSTGITIPTDYWDNEAQVVRSSHKKRSYPQASSANAFLEQTKGEIGRVLSALVLNKKRPTSQLLTQHLEEFRKTTKPNTSEKGSNQFFDKFKLYLEERKKYVKPKTYYNLQRTETYLKEFKTEERLTITFETFTPDLYERFIDYLFSKDISPSTARNHGKAIRAFLKYVDDRGIASIHYTKFKLPKEHVPEIIALSEEELRAIETASLSDDRRLQQTRDLFLIQCYTGLRFSDAVSISPENINLREEQISLYVDKTGDYIRIPIVEQLRQILLAYELTPPRMTNQEMNRSIKQVALIAGLHTPTVKKEYEGSKQIEKTVPKWKAVTSHTGRKTFCTLSLLGGMIPEMVMKISGHRDYKSFRRYLEITDTKTAEAMRQVWGNRD